MSWNDTNERRKVKKQIVVHSINNSDESLCVDIFQRDDNSFGFEEYRRDPETNEGWYKVGFFEQSIFSSEGEAYKNACKHVVWLDEERLRWLKDKMTLERERGLES